MVFPAKFGRDWGLRVDKFIAVFVSANRLVIAVTVTWVNTRGLCPIGLLVCDLHGLVEFGRRIGDHTPFRKSKERDAKEKN